ncbi:MAG TPA: DUF3570 domain-containing protein [Steroidobacteraceae bacterium]|nr:DUF3570 domain-containing protein [Steroidobacteraceae bacterium]
MRTRWHLLLAFVIGGTPVVAGVLPDDRADVLYHRYQGGGITIQGPSVLVRKKVGDNFSLSAGYYEDMISSASIDVKLTASPYKENRKQENFSVDYLHGKTTYSAGYIHSREPDYASNTTFYSLSQDMFGDLTTVSLTYKRGWDRVYKDEKDAATGQIINDPHFFGGSSSATADHRGWALGISQILTRSLLASFNYELLEDEGYLQSPYRQIRFLDPTDGKGYRTADQTYPHTRTSNSASLLLKYFLPYRAAVSGQYRYFQDTWGIVGHTFEVDYTHPIKRAVPFLFWPVEGHVVLDGSLRYYRQNAADFYSDLFPRQSYQNFEARDRELAAFNSYAIGFGATYEFPQLSWAPWINKSTVNVRLDHLIIDYSDFRAVYTGSGIAPGTEPLYKLNANVFQVFVSAWY